MIYQITHKNVLENLKINFDIMKQNANVVYLVKNQSIISNKNCALNYSAYLYSYTTEGYTHNYLTCSSMQHKVSDI